MTLTKSLLLGSAATLVAFGAQAADLPSQKAAPVAYVKVCDAYGAGFFVIPGTDTCIRIGGYVRAEYQYVPAQNSYSLRYANSTTLNLQGVNANIAGAGTNAYMVTSTSGSALSATSSALAPANVGTSFQPLVAGAGLNRLYVQPGATATSSTFYGQIIQTLSENADAQSTTGYEVRGRIDVDARTPTAFGPARTFVRIRLANTSGIRNTTITNNLGYTQGVASTTSPTLESASVQWAGFTFGVAPENYAMMPSQFYNANPWTGFPNGMKQIAYTAMLGGGLSATLALEDANDMNYAQQYRDRFDNAAVIVGNIRLDQTWGFLAVHGMVGKNTIQKNWVNYTYVPAGLNSSGSEITAAYAYIGPFSTFGAPVNPNTISTGVTGKTGWAIGTTVNFKLPMIAPGDQLWLTANYTDGQLGALLSSGGLSNVNTAANKRLMGGLVRVDQNMIPTSSTTFDNTTGWNVAAAFTHYWAPQWRSNFSAGYVEINPPTVRNGSAGIQWGKGQLQVYTAGLIYSPVKDLDIGLETQYASLKNEVQNWAPTAPALVGLNPSNWTTKLRVERSF
jgi:hypothetical protein